MAAFVDQPDFDDHFDVEYNMSILNMALSLNPFKEDDPPFLEIRDQGRWAS